MSKPPTITDVAKAAGVSLSAVSFVLNGKADKYRISPTTQARIRAAISQLDFHPTQAARDITKGQSRDSYRAAPEPIPVPDVVAAVPSGGAVEPEPPREPVQEAPAPEPVITEQPTPAVAPEPLAEPEPVPEPKVAAPTPAPVVVPEPSPIPDIVAAVPSADKVEPESPSIQLVSESVAPSEETKTVPSNAPQADTQQPPQPEPAP